MKHQNEIMPMPETKYHSMGKVLILNANYEALDICDTEKACVLVYLDKAQVVNSLEGRMLRTPNKDLPFPSIIRLNHFVRIPFKKVVLSRRNVIRRDGHKCAYCGTYGVSKHGGSLTIDHIYPKSRGGRDSWDNLVTACMRCNNKKGDLTPDEAGMKLLYRPVKPNHVVFMRQFVGKAQREWEPYLFMNS